MMNHPQRARALRITVYYVVAISLAAASRFVWHTNDVTGAWPSLRAMHWHLLSGVGPFLGAIIVWVTFRIPRWKSLGGSDGALACLMLAVPAAVMGVMGISNPYALNAHVFGCYVGLWIAVYAILEETGWRGYLQDEFREHPPLFRYIVVGLFWYPWHFTFLQHHTLQTELAILMMLLLASIGIGFVADRTQSIFAAASIHSSANILGLTTFFTIFVPSTSTRLIVVGVCVFAWAALLRIWRHRAAHTSSSGTASAKGAGQISDGS